MTALGQDANGRLLIGTASAGHFLFRRHRRRTETVVREAEGRGDLVDACRDDSGFGSLPRKGLYFYQSGQLKDVVRECRARSLQSALTIHEASLVRHVGQRAGESVPWTINSERLSRVWTLNRACRRNACSPFCRNAPRRHAKASSPAPIAALSVTSPARVAPTVLPARIISQRIHQPKRAGRQACNSNIRRTVLLLDVTAISSRTFPEQFQYAFALYDSSGKIIRQKLSHDSQFAMEQLAARQIQSQWRARLPRT